MITLSKYLGNYEAYTSAIKNHGIKWSNNNDSLTAFVRILNGNNLKGLTQWYQQAYSIFNDNEKMYLRFLALSGVRKTEAKMAFDKIREMARAGKLEEYYNSETKMLEHFRYKQFLRGTKNLYVSAVPYELIEQIANSENTISLSSMRKKLNRNKMPLRFKELRQFYATNMRKLGLMQELISLLQGRVERTVFTQFYLKENPKELSERAIMLIEKLEQILKQAGM
jgi:intergrase/recombinase